MYIKYYTNEQTAFGGDETTGIDIQASLHNLLDQIETALRAAYPDARIETGIDLGGLDTDADDERENILAIAESAWQAMDWIVQTEGGQPLQLELTICDDGTVTMNKAGGENVAVFARLGKRTGERREVDRTVYTFEPTDRELGDFLQTLMGLVRSGLAE